MRVKEYQAITLSGFGCAGLVWAFVGMLVFIEWPIGSVWPPNVADAVRLVLFLPATLGALVPFALVSLGLTTLDPFTVPSLVGIDLGLVAGLVALRRI